MKKSLFLSTILVIALLFASPAAQAQSSAFLLLHRPNTWLFTQTFSATPGIKLTVGAGSGLCLVSDASGNASWGACSGGTPAFPLLAPDGSIGAPSYSFSGDTTMGMAASTSGTHTLYFNYPATGQVEFTSNSDNTTGIGFVGNPPQMGAFFSGMNDVGIFGNEFRTFRATDSFRVGSFTPSVPSASAGAVRLPSNTAINWRNAGNSADLGLTLNGSDVFVFGATVNVPTLTMTANGSHINQFAAAKDIAGTIAIVAGTSAAHTFSTAYGSAPICTLSPITDPGLTQTWWVTTSTTVVTANISTSATITFNYICVGNPN